MRHTILRLAQAYIDRHARAPRGLGMTVDDGMPDRGTRYGGAQTIHNTGTVDVVLSEDGDVTEVWFRCQMLAARVSRPTGHPAYLVPGAPLVAVELAHETPA